MRKFYINRINCDGSMINGFNPKIPILMYHEISDVLSNGKNSFNKMTPLYNIPAAIFENQISFLASTGYKSLLPEEVKDLSEDGKYIIITFDDGLNRRLYRRFFRIKL